MQSPKHGNASREKRYTNKYGEIHAISNTDNNRCETFQDYNLIA
jgi:hypothetical protein